MKKPSVLLCALIAVPLVLPLALQAQYLAWHYDRLIENNDGYRAFDPQVAISGSCAVAVWTQSDGAYSRVYANYSLNGGQTWHADRLIEDNGTQARGASVAVSGLVAVAAWSQMDNGYYRVFTSSSIDGGKTWRADQMIQDAAGGSALGYPPQVAVSGSKVVVAWTQSDGSVNRVYVNSSSNGGRTWRGRQAIDAVTGYNSGPPSLALSGSNALVVWANYAVNGQDGRICVNYSSDGGASWHSERMIETDAYGAWYYPPRAAMSGNRAVVVWSHERIYTDYSTDGGATWNGWRTINPLAFTNGRECRVAVSGTRAVAVWMDFGPGAYWYIYANSSNDGGSTWNGPEPIQDTSSFSPDGYSVSLSGSNAVAVWRLAEAGGGARVWINYSTDGGLNWRSMSKIDGYSGTTAASCVPSIGISGDKVIAAWLENDGVSDRVVANYAGLYASPKAFLRPPKLLGPASGSVAVPIPATLTWQDTNSGDAQETKYMIRVKPAGGVYAYYTAPANATSYVLAKLARNRTYSWNVRAVGSGTAVVTSSWANGGVDWKFTTLKAI